ncbi:MAG TPA: peptide chain release factor 2, partial [Alphaproteobacteria bacterium]|nr:peptide chain release factor 2 [Alphaproteobacteria bacterium]
MNARAEHPDFWNDPQKAQALMRERNRLEAAMTAIQEIEQELSDTLELAEMAEAEGDDDMIDEADAVLKRLKDKAARAELEALLSGEADANDAYLEIHPGAGGTESQDWASMLARMYTRWGNARGFKVEVIEEQPGDEAGIKSVTLLFKGENAY